MRVLGARRMVVDGGTGGNDSAALTGTAGNDAFFASPTSASLSGADYAIGLRGFRTVSVQAGSGGRDTATLVGSAGADQLTASSRTSTLSGSGFRFDATGFTVVNVDGGGGKDTATITDGLVQGPLNSGLVGTLPAPYRSALWLSRFSQIKQTKKSPGQTPPTAAVDLVFAAFWK
jgi:hypothetical protein